MKRGLGIVYSIAAGLCFVVGSVCAFWFAWESAGAVGAFVGGAGFVFSLLFAPALHECGHIVFARAQGMRVCYTKFSFFRFAEVNGKLRFSLASPFAPEETQTVPVCGGNMKKRARLYTAGGLIFGGAYLLLLSAGGAIAYMISSSAALFFLCAVPYAVYLLLLNVFPGVYGAGKTDAAILRGIARGEAEETSMVSAMEIHGRLSGGERFSEIDESLYFDTPQLPENAPRYAIMLDLRYRFYLDKGDEKSAADCLNRLVASAPYLSPSVRTQTAAELVYMHAVGGNIEGAQKNAELCKEYLKSDSLIAKRALAAYSLLLGQTEAAAELKKQAERLSEKEKIKGLARSEKVLFDRLFPSDDCV